MTFKYFKLTPKSGSWEGLKVVGSNDKIEYVEVSAAEVMGSVVKKTNEIQEGCDKIFNHYGIQSQTLKLIEELSELTIEACQPEIDWEKFAEELADVMVMCQQFKNYVGGGKVTKIMKQKIERTLKNI